MELAYLQRAPFLPGLYAAIAFHEAGHLLAGSMVGLDAGGISVGPFSLIKSGKNWTFQFERRNWTGGFFKPLSGTADRDAAPYRWMIAGGPLASGPYRDVRSTDRSLRQRNVGL
jgi:hypothetical protein